MIDEQGGVIIPQDGSVERWQEARQMCVTAENVYAGVCRLIDRLPAGELLGHCRAILPMVDLIHKQTRADMQAAQQYMEDYENRVNAEHNQAEMSKHTSRFTNPPKTAS